MRTGRLPSEWAAELDRDQRSVWTVLGLMQEQDQASRAARQSND